jgi:hypothetical protein
MAAAIRILPAALITRFFGPAIAAGVFLALWSAFNADLRFFWARAIRPRHRLILRFW